MRGIRKKASPREDDQAESREVDISKKDVGQIIEAERWRLGFFGIYALLGIGVGLVVWGCGWGHPEALDIGKTTLAGATGALVAASAALSMRAETNK